ncbi:MAG: response regulator [Geobacteraceae bacterium]|nr:response regulator [Geobacteraceae bacterium]
MKNILIVSSSPSFLERNGTLLRRSDFRILTADNTSEALSIFQSELIELLFIDTKIDEETGETFCSRIRNCQSKTKPVIILVCNDSEEEFARLKGSGADAIIARPIKPLQLIKTVGQFLSVQLVRSRRVSLRVKVISKKDEVEFFCISHNISLTGMLIETEFSLDVGSVIICQFSIPGSLDVETEGEIVRSARTMDGAHLYGIHFTTLSRNFRHEIDQYIASVIRGD